MHESDEPSGGAANPPEESAAPSPAAASAPATAELRLGDASFMSDAYAAYDKLRDRGAVVRVHVPALPPRADETEDRGLSRDLFGKDVLFVARYEEAALALLHEDFSVDPRLKLTAEQRAQQATRPAPEPVGLYSRSLFTVDPPDHTRLRRLVQPSFGAATMEALRPRIQRITDDLLDSAARAAEERGERAPDRQMDLVAAFANPLPLTVISDMVGIPLEDRPRVQAWADAILLSPRGRRLTRQMTASAQEFVAYLRALFAEKRERPTDDLASQLVHAKEDGDMLDEAELISMVRSIYQAGHTTMESLIGNGVVALLRNPAQLARLKADPSLVKGVVEETLRYWGPVDTVTRRVATEASLGGATITERDEVMISLAAANRDPRRFANPEVFDITRPDASRHLAFGKGIHLCLGAPLARIEGQIAFETLFRRFPDLRLAVPAEELRWNTNFLRGFPRIPVRF